MITLYIASLFAINVLSKVPDCDYGYFTSNNNTCMFNCEYNGKDFAPISSLSFNFISSQCTNVQKAYERGICNSLNDLVYREDFCTCPYCKCSFNGSEAIEKLTNKPSQECSDCTCSSTQSSRSGITDNIYECDQLIQVDQAWQWDLYSCPPNECIDIRPNGGQRTYHAGDTWWADVEDSNTTTCNKLCHCPATGDAICSTGYADILDTSSGLNPAFTDHCGYFLQAVK